MQSPIKRLRFDSDDSSYSGSEDLSIPDPEPVVIKRMQLDIEELQKEQREQRALFNAWITHKRATEQVHPCHVRKDLSVSQSFQIESVIDFCRKALVTPEDTEELRSKLVHLAKS